MRSTIKEKLDYIKMHPHFDIKKNKLIPYSTQNSFTLNEKIINSLTVSDSFLLKKIIYCVNPFHVPYTPLDLSVRNHNFNDNILHSFPVNKDKVKYLSEKNKQDIINIFCQNFHKKLRNNRSAWLNGAKVLSNQHEIYCTHEYFEKHKFELELSGRPYFIFTPNFYAKLENTVIKEVRKILAKQLRTEDSSTIKEKNILLSLCTVFLQEFNAEKSNARYILATHFLKKIPKGVNEEDIKEFQSLQTFLFPYFDKPKTVLMDKFTIQKIALLAEYFDQTSKLLTPSQLDKIKHVFLDIMIFILENPTLALDRNYTDGYQKAEIIFSILPKLEVHI